MSRERLLRAAAAIALFPASLAAAAGVARVQPWRATGDVIEGWDWSLPRWVEPAPRSGVAFSGRSPPAFRGNRLHDLDWSWRRIEPVRGKYDFESLRREIERSSRHADGVILHVRASTWSTELPESASGRSRPGTAPAWLVEEIGVSVMDAEPMTNLSTPFTVRNLDIADERYHLRYLAMVRALGESGIPRLPEVTFAVVHGVSRSRGEETWIHGSGSRVARCMEERLDAWAAAFDGVERKLAWVGGEPGGELLQRAYALGMGQRDGTAEYYLDDVENAALGQHLDADGYLVTDETCPPIAGNRAFGDENEEYSRPVHVPRYGSVETWGDRYRESMLRVLQQRRRYVVAESNPWVNPPLLAFVGLELGRTVEDAPDVWCSLRESFVRTGGEVRPVKNFERWLHQRDRDGCRTTACVSVEQGTPRIAPGVPPELRHDLIARRTDVAAGSSRIGFAVDDRFRFGGPHDVAVKVTYHDVGTGAWSLVVPTGGDDAVRTVRCEGTEAVRTATFFVDDAHFPATDMEFDFEIRAVDGDATISFVRVVRGVLDSATVRRPTPQPPSVE